MSKLLYVTCAALAGGCLVIAACSSFSPAEAPDAGGSGDAASDSAGDIEEAATDGPDASPDRSSGCADGTREGFPDHPRIAACQGAWDRPGILPEAAPRCERRAGNDGDAATGEGCGSQDLCAEGWHVCRNAAEVQTRGGTAKGPCALPAAPGDGGTLFYATAQASPRAALCDPDASAGYNDVFGCGDLGLRLGPTCSPLNTNITNDDHPPQFNAGSATMERLNVTKKPGPGGVLCCVDE
ncbi:MAG: Type fimbrial biosis protein PilY1 [Labilithrix sp.]|nr:Type fimbrial biosis protein PilY1 [Labilithrix sp.]